MTLRLFNTRPAQRGGFGVERKEMNELDFKVKVLVDLLSNRVTGKVKIENSECFGCLRLEIINEYRNFYFVMRLENYKIMTLPVEKIVEIILENYKCEILSYFIVDYLIQ